MTSNPSPQADQGGRSQVLRLRERAACLQLWLFHLFYEGDGPRHASYETVSPSNLGRPPTGMLNFEFGMLKSNLKFTSAFSIQHSALYYVSQWPTSSARSLNRCVPACRPSWTDSSARWTKGISRRWWTPVVRPRRTPAASPSPKRSRRTTLSFR